MEEMGTFLIREIDSVSGTEWQHFWDCHIGRTSSPLRVSQWQQNGRVANGHFFIVIFSQLNIMKIVEKFNNLWWQR